MCALVRDGSSTARFLPVLPGRDGRRGLHLLDGVSDPVAATPLVRDCPAGIHALQQRRSLRRVVSMTAGQDEPCWLLICVDAHVAPGGQPTSGTPQSSRQRWTDSPSSSRRGCRLRGKVVCTRFSMPSIPLRTVSQMSGWDTSNIARPDPHGQRVHRHRLSGVLGQLEKPCVFPGRDIVIRVLSLPSCSCALAPVSNAMAHGLAVRCAATGEV